MKITKSMKKMKDDDVNEDGHYLADRGRRVHHWTGEQ